jgi:hypothetical protein
VTDARTPLDRNAVRRRLVGSLFLASGAALVTYIVSGISLLWTLIGAIGFATLLGQLAWRRSDDDGRRRMRRGMAAGAVAGVAATLCYDVSRFALIQLTGIEFWPFDIFGIFGRALFGEGNLAAWVPLAGFAYHVTNGIGFAIAYTLLVGERGVSWGIAWGLGLEAMMLTFYPGWLDIRAIEEFVSVSVVGHVVYGAVLGWTAQRLLLRATPTPEVGVA